MPAVVEREVNGYVISTDPARLQLETVWRFLHDVSEWARGISYETVLRTIQHSVNFGCYTQTGEQVGFARVVTDYGQFAYLCDVFVLPEHRGRGLGIALVETVLDHPDLQGLRRVALDAADRARTLYARFGFGNLSDPTSHMEILRSPDEVFRR